MAKSKPEPGQRVSNRLEYSTWKTIARNEGYSVSKMTISDAAFRLWFVLRLMMYESDGYVRSPKRQASNGMVWVTTRDICSFLKWSSDKTNNAFEELYSNGLLKKVKRGQYRVISKDLSWLFGPESDLPEKSKLGSNTYTVSKRANSSRPLGMQKEQTEAILRSPILGVGGAYESKRENEKEKKEEVEKRIQEVEGEVLTDFLGIGEVESGVRPKSEHYIFQSGPYAEGGEKK